MMTTVFVVCEGQTEETIISRVIAPAFYPMGIALVAQLIETSPGHKGGALIYERVHQHLRNTLRRPTQPFVTTLIDLYKLDNGFPDYAAATRKPFPESLSLLTQAFHKNVVDSVGCRPDRFLPYIQPFEFEALLFSDVRELTAVEPGWGGAADELQRIRDAVESPEHIDDGPQTKPAARLSAHLTDPPFRKLLHGPLAAGRITISKMEAECLFFAGWLNQVRALQPKPS